MRLKKWHLLGLLMVALPAAQLPATAAAPPAVTTVTSGLDSPRGIAFYGGKLVVAEAGHGGSDCFSAPVPGGHACVGPSSQISWVNRSDGSHTPLVSGLYSIRLGPLGVEGLSGLSSAGRRLFAEFGGTPLEDPTALGQAEAGRLISVHRDGSWTAVAPVGATDFAYTTQFPEPNPGVCGQCPGSQEHDANPYGVMASGAGAYVADAGANTLDFVREDGTIKILLHDAWRDPNPNFPSDAVPTCVVRGEDGLLVGELSGRLLSVHHDSFHAIDLKDASGNALLTHVTGCASDGEGNVYFVNMFGSGPAFTPPPASNFFIGNVVRYNTETGHASILVDGLHFPNMDAIGPDGNLYVTTGSICPSTPSGEAPCFGATGGIVKITLPHDEDQQ